MHAGSREYGNLQKEIKDVSQNISFGEPTPSGGADDLDIDNEDSQVRDVDRTNSVSYQAPMDRLMAQNQKQARPEPNEFAPMARDIDIDSPRNLNDSATSQRSFADDVEDEIKIQREFVASNEKKLQQ